MRSRESVKESCSMNSTTKMNDTRASRREKNQHIQVFVRVKPMNNAEKNGKAFGVVEVPSDSEVIVYERYQDKVSKKFTFDKVFGSETKQVDVYNVVVRPMLEEVLAGYNCTVFAYGQTGTGKTYTMEGVSNDTTLHWQSDTNAGMIPRALGQLFDELRLLPTQEYTVRVSFLELYNEELFDLLSANDDTSKIRLYEDASKRGSVIIHGLEEVTVHTKSEVYKILQKGSEKRQIAATLMNAHSSRSHTVFSITIHIKENTVNGEDLLKTGKLNLVDLAGSENIGKSGAVDRRAREAGSINQSLLTLGRVITALVERAPHVPYRESKLTRLLQESLGGRTKTSIIATISESCVNVEETLSTLDYAHRAKNITNRPEINQKLCKKALLKEYTEEIERLRRDLLATREQNGVYLAYENYNEMQALIERQSKEIEEKINNIKALEETVQNIQKLFDDLRSEHEVQTVELCTKKTELETVSHVLKSTESQLHMTEQDRDEQNYLLEKHVSTENVLLSQAQALLNVADTASVDTHKLHDKINRQKQVESENKNLSETFRENVIHRFLNIQNDVTINTQQFEQFCDSIQKQIETQVAFHRNNIGTKIQQMSNNFTNEFFAASDKVSDDVGTVHTGYHEWTEKQLQNTTCMTEHERSMLANISTKLGPRIFQLVETEIAKNLQDLNAKVSQALENLSAHTKENIYLMCNHQLQERDRICQNVEKNITKTVQDVISKQDEMLQKRQTMAMTMQNLLLQFNNLNKNEEETTSATIGTLQQVAGISNSISSQISHSYDTMIDEKKKVQETIQNNIVHLQDNIATNARKNTSLAEMTLEGGKKLINEIKAHIDISRDTLSIYNRQIKSDVKQLQQKLETNRNNIFTLIHENNAVVTNTVANTTKFMEEENCRVLNTYQEIDHKLKNHNAKSLEWSNKTCTELQSMHSEIDKFFFEDLRYDIPTGLTPERRDFSYPRQFAVTSPHERIIERFRETRKLVETVEEEDNTVVDSDTTLKEQCNTLAEVTLTSPVINKMSCVTSTPYSTSSCRLKTSPYSANHSRRTTSPSSISKCTSIISRTRSESSGYIRNDDKENEGGEFVKPEKRSKRMSKSRRQKEINRQALGTHN